MNDVSTCVLCLFEELVFHDNEVINNPHGPMDCEGSALSSVFSEKGTRQRMYSQRAISFSVAKGRYEYVFLLDDGRVIQRVRLG